MKQQQNQTSSQKRLRTRHTMMGNKGGANGQRSNGGGDPKRNAMNRRNAEQLHDKYVAAGNELAMSGDRVEAERFYQLADHYYRLAHPEEQRSEERNIQPSLETEEALLPGTGADGQTHMEASTHPASPPHAPRSPRGPARVTGGKQPKETTPPPAFAAHTPTVQAINFPFEDMPQPDIDDSNPETDIEKLLGGSL